MEQIFEFPPIYAINTRINGNIIQQLVQPGYSLEVKIEKYTKQRVKGYLVKNKNGSADAILVITNNAQPSSEFGKVLHVKSKKPNDIESFLAEFRAARKKWLRHPGLEKIPKEPITYEKRTSRVINSWFDTFQYKTEDLTKKQDGLRPPQIGAVHAVHAYWTVSEQAATIVMPTGTGKTETMLSVLISKQCQKLLVIVPTDALRTQIAEKFLSLGILKKIGAISNDAEYPIVGILKHKPKDRNEVDIVFEKCNIVVTTMNIAGQCSTDVQERIADHCPFLFIDEAHHIGAPTWKNFRQFFSSKKILQFTATPFRNDDKPVGGQIIFNYPLKKAQEEDYFRPISFEPVIEFDLNQADRKIAEKAVQQLRKDREKHNHILMARVESIDRAKEVFAIYQQYIEFNPVQIHTGIKSTQERDKIRQSILSGDAKIIVCVDMLGEGFDLPELKIAAFHDVRKSLAVTLQLAGRFTRYRSDLGDATFIANIADINVREELSKLYTRDPDWNVLLRQISETVIQEQVDLREFIKDFRNFPEDIPLQNIRPAMSTVIYKTTCEDWMPEQFLEGIRSAGSLERIHHDINYQKNTLIIVTAQKIPIPWAQINEIFSWNWELYLVFWDEEQNLLFIHSSNNNSYYKKLAERIAGEVELVRGSPVFRCFSGINRLKLQNVGLSEQFGRLISYIGRMGADVETGLTEAQKRNARKSVVFGNGYENGSKTSVGCSFKGRIWSHRTANLETLTKWCRFIGKKVLDDTIDPEEVLRGTLISTFIVKRPHKIPIGIDWPEKLYKEIDTAFTFVFGQLTARPLHPHEIDIELKGHTEKGVIKFNVSSDNESVDFEIKLFQKNEIKDYQFSTIGSQKIWIKQGASHIPLDEFFYNDPPIIWFVNGASLEGNKLTELKKQPDPYPKEKIKTWDWTGINIKNESQGIEKDSTSIQHRVIQELKKAPNDIIYDDDGSGEVADVVTISIGENAIAVELYHCKFSLENTPGARIDDLYAVCGQAQKSIQWIDKPTELFARLLRHEPKKEKNTDKTETRYEKGNQDTLFQVKEMSRVLLITFKIFIVQPGLSKAKASSSQRELLSVTENYLMETYKIPFEVIASP